jgi:soluble lytic murein transglycosylase-like protein
MVVPIVRTMLALALLIPGASARADVYEFGSDGAFSRVDRTSTPAISAPSGSVSSRELDELTGPARARTILTAITLLSRRHNLNPALVEAVAWQESRLHPDALSPKGAIGVMQLMPGTAARMGINPHEWRTNVAGGIALLSSLLRRYNNDLLKALAAYNAGTAAVDRYNGVPPFRETRAYVAAVLERLASRAMQTNTRAAG